MIFFMIEYKLKEREAFKLWNNAIFFKIKIPFSSMHQAGFQIACFVHSWVDHQFNLHHMSDFDFGGKTEEERRRGRPSNRGLG